MSVEWTVQSKKKIMRRGITGVAVSVTRIERDVLDVISRQDSISVPYIRVQGRTQTEVLQDLYRAVTRVWEATISEDADIASYFSAAELETALNNWEATR